jgi:hypothetical protein
MVTYRGVCRGKSNSGELMDELPNGAGTTPDTPDTPEPKQPKELKAIKPEYALKDTTKAQRDLLLLARRKMIVDGILEGMTYREIAEHIIKEFNSNGWALPSGFDERYVYKDKERIILEDKAELDESTQHLRWMELKRLDKMQSAIYPRAINPATVNYASVKAVLDIQNQRAKYMPGLQLPQKVSLTDPTGEREGTGNVFIYVPDNGRDGEIDPDDMEGFDNEQSP